MPSKRKPFRVKVRWGEGPDYSRRQYSFATAEEREAFLWGAEEAFLWGAEESNGWQGFIVADRINPTL